MEKAIEIRMADGTADGFLYTPDGAGPWPGVIQLTDIHGIRPVARDLGKRIAAKGYVVLMPNVPKLWMRRREKRFKAHHQTNRRRGQGTCVKRMIRRKCGIFSTSSSFKWRMILSSSTIVRVSGLRIWA